MNVPQLRFDGFGGEWDLKNLSEVVTLFGGNAFHSRDATSSGVRWLKIANVSYGKTVWKDPSFLPSQYIEEYQKYLLFEDDIVMALTRPIINGKLKIAILGKEDIPSLLNQRVAKLVCTEDTNEKFIYQLLRQRKVVADIESLISGTDPPNIGNGELKKISIFVPLKAEQEKIATFLTLLDRKTLMQQEKIEKLEQFKKGMMQKVFTQELRFKDEDAGEFGEFGEWEEKKIGAVLKIKHGRDQKKIETPNGKFPILATGGTIGRTDTSIYDKESVLIGRKGTIDRPVYMDSPFWTVDTLFYSEIKQDNYPKFLFYIFQNINWKLYNEASGVPSLSAKIIEAIKTTIPTYKEQKVIADYLSIIDSKINKEKEKLMVLEEQKKGFMQGMFP